MQSKLIEYYNWLDIRTAICEEMGIDEKKHFRDYHKLVGGEYKDLWHEWMNYFDGNVRNDTFVFCDLGERKECKIEWVIENDKEWLVDFIDAVYVVWDKYEIEYIQYSW